MDFGRWEGKNTGELTRAKDPTFLKWAAGKKIIPPGGESMASLQKRTRAFLKYVLKRQRGKTVLLVSHAGALKTMICSLLGIPLKSFWVFRIDPASASIFDFYTSYTQCVTLNCTHYLVNGQ